MPALATKGHEAFRLFPSNPKCLVESQQQGCESERRNLLI